MSIHFLKMCFSSAISLTSSRTSTNLKVLKLTVKGTVDIGTCNMMLQRVIDVNRFKFHVNRLEVK